MSRSLRIGLHVLLLLGAVTAARGNEAAPQRPPRRPAGERKEVLPRGARRVSLTVEVDDRVKEARLQIPANLLPPAAPARGADAGPWHLPTVVAGVALTLSLASGGLWLLRRGAVRRAAAGGLLLGLFALGGAALFANVPIINFERPPPNAPAPPGPLPTLLLPADVRLSPNVVLEVVEKGDGIKLIVNKAMLGKPGGSAVAPAPKKAEGSYE